MSDLEGNGSRFKVQGSRFRVLVQVLWVLVLVSGTLNPEP
jgi:hypothetical protein